MAISQLTGKNFQDATIDIINNTINTLPVTNLNSGTNASASTFFTGNNTWSAIDITSITNSPPRERKQGGTTQNPGKTSIALTHSGPVATAVASGSTALQQSSDGEYIKYTTSGVSGSTGGWKTAGTVRITQLQWKPIITFVFRTDSDITNIRLWMGLFSSDPTTTSTPTNYVALRYATDASSLNVWDLCTNGGSLSSLSGGAIAINTRYVFQIDATNPASVKFYINGVLKGTQTNNLPSTTTPLDFYAMVTCLTGSSPKAINLSKVHYEHQNT